MLPIVATLIANGLGLVGNAVLAKGKDVIEKKLGIDIESALETDTGKQSLLQIQNDHEEFLLNAALAHATLVVEDIKSAREMNSRVNESANAGWLPKNINALLSLLVIVGGGLVLYFSQDTEVRMASVGLMTMVLGFHFGTSQSSRGKDAVIEGMSKRKSS